MWSASWRQTGDNGSQHSKRLTVNEVKRGGGQGDFKGFLLFCPMDLTFQCQNPLPSRLILKRKTKSDTVNSFKTSDQRLQNEVQQIFGVFAVPIKY